MENIKLYVSTFGSILTCFLTSLVFFSKMVKSKKQKTNQDKTETLSKQIIPCIKEAEKFLNYTGQEKLEYVITKLNRYAIDFDLSFNIDDVTDKIEELIDMSKEVNGISDEKIKILIEGIKKNEL